MQLLVVMGKPWLGMAAMTSLINKEQQASKDRLHRANMANNHKQVGTVDLSEEQQGQILMVDVAHVQLLR